MERCNELKQSRLGQEFEGGYRDAQEKWPATQDRMIMAMSKLEAAVRPFVQDLKRILPED